MINYENLFEITYSVISSEIFLIKSFVSKDKNYVDSIYTMPHAPLTLL